jgi:hypothetical protein
MGGLLQGVADYYVGGGGGLRRRALAEAVEVAEGRALGVRYLQRAETKPEIQAGKRTTVETVAADAVILAVPWSAVSGLLPEGLRSRAPFAGLTQLEALPAVTVEMWVDRVVVHRPATSIRDGGVAWVIDRGHLFGREGAPQHLAVGLSPEWAREAHTNAEWIELTGRSGPHLPRDDWRADPAGDRLRCGRCSRPAPLRRGCTRSPDGGSNLFLGTRPTQLAIGRCSTVGFAARVWTQRLEID